MLFVCHFLYHMVDGLYINVIGFLIGEDRFSSLIHMTVTKEMNTFFEENKNDEHPLLS